MSFRAPAVRVDGLGKAYEIQHNRGDHVTLAELALDRVLHPLRRAATERLWALRNVSFEVQQGEVLGVIGRNGSGKSTLLKLLTRVTAPTEGRIDLWGRVGSLLEVGTGFHPELTGRENIYLNGSILGMSKRGIDRRFESIVEFASVERFLDTPVKRYSSGMYVRLGFAIAAHLDAEILLLDEILAVGDGEFQLKCFRKVVSLATEGRAVVLVSHNLAAVQQFTTRALMLRSGTLVAAGATNSVVRQYSEIQSEILVNTAELPRLQDGWGEDARILSVALDRPTNVIAAADDISFLMTVRTMTQLRGRCVSVGVRPVGGAVLGVSFSPRNLDLTGNATHTLRITLPSPALAPGQYFLNIALGSGDRYSDVNYNDGVVDAIIVEIEPSADETGRSEVWDPAWGHTRYQPLRVHHDVAEAPALP